MSARCTGADFTGADLSHANLIGADLSHANLHRANLSGAILIGANLTEAKLCETNLEGAILCDTVLVGLNLGHALCLDTCRHDGPSAVDFSTLKLSGSLPVEFLRSCGLPEILIDYLPSILHQAIEFYSCFISYSRTDEKFARRLHDELQRRGIRCWLDRHQILPGDDLHEQIQHGIRLWDKVLLCCSEASLKSWWVDNEIETAFSKERQLMELRGQKTLALIPLDIDGFMFSDACRSGKKEQIKCRVAADFTGWTVDARKFQSAVDRLVRALRADGMGRGQPPPSKL